MSSTFEQTHENRRSKSLTVLGQSDTGREKFKFKGPDMETYSCIYCWKNSQEISMAGTECLRYRMLEDKVRE